MSAVALVEPHQHQIPPEHEQDFASKTPILHAVGICIPCTCISVPQMLFRGFLPAKAYSGYSRSFDHSRGLVQCPCSRDQAGIPRPLSAFWIHERATVSNLLTEPACAFNTCAHRTAPWTLQRCVAFFQFRPSLYFFSLSAGIDRIEPRNFNFGAIGALVWKQLRERYIGPTSGGCSIRS